MLVAEADVPAVLWLRRHVPAFSVWLSTFIRSCKKKRGFNVMLTTFVLSVVKSFTSQTQRQIFALASALVRVRTVSHFCT